MKKIAGLIVGMLLYVMNVFSQQAPFYNDIQEFKKQDKANPPPQNAIVFVGSSSFTKWHDVQHYFPGYTIINRGFGGSTLPEVTAYANDIVFPYNPKQVVIYCGDNDLASADSVSAQVVLDRFKKLFQSIRRQLPLASVVFVSIKPSPSRKQLMPAAEEANKKIKKYLKKQRNTAFVDVYHKMLHANGSIMGELFIEDSLHMNAKGYAIWQKAIEPYLVK